MADDAECTGQHRRHDVAKPSRVYWKKLTLFCQRDVIEVFTLLPEIGGWAKSRKTPELVDEMRLIVIATGERDIYPLVRRTTPDLAKHFLKTLQAAKLLRRQSDLVTEHLNEPPV